MSDIAYGAFAGQTVYAVPQVIAAASPFGVVAIQMGMLVKLVRGLMLGPICLGFSLIAPRLAPEAVPDDELVAGPANRRPGIGHLVPWFNIGLLALVVCRTMGLVPTGAIVPLGRTATALTKVSTAALGLGVDIGVVVKAGGRVTAVAVLSLFGLGAIGFALPAALGLA